MWRARFRFTRGFGAQITWRTSSAFCLKHSQAETSDLLVRWLLKVSFNSSRTDGAHRHLFEDLVPYMLGNEARPRRGRVTVAAYLAGAERIAPAKRAAVPYLKNVDTEQPFNPFLVRICYGAV